MCTLQLIDSPAKKNRNLQRLKCMQNNGYDRAYMAIFNWLFLSFFPLIAFCVVNIYVFEGTLWLSTLMIQELIKPVVYLIDYVTL